MEGENDANIGLFVEITGATVEQAISYLNFADGNLEQATTLFYAEGVQPPEQQLSGGIQEVRAPIAPQQQSPFLPSRDNFNYDPDFDDNESVEESLFPPRNRATSSQSDERVDAKYDQLQAMFSLPERLNRINSNLEVSKQLALRQKKLLLVTIHDPKEFQSHCLIRDLWTKDIVVDYINEHFVFCYYVRGQMNAKSHEISYPVMKYPYVAIIDPLTGERLAEFSTMEPNDFIEFCAQVQQNGQRTHELKRNKPVSELTEEEQLELALKASIAEAPTTIVIEDDEPVDGLVFILHSAFDSIEPVDIPEPSGPDVTRIQFRCPGSLAYLRQMVSVSFESLTSPV